MAIEVEEEAAAAAAAVRGIATTGEAEAVMDDTAELGREHEREEGALRERLRLEQVRQRDLLLRRRRRERERRLAKLKSEGAGEDELADAEEAMDEDDAAMLADLDAAFDEQTLAPLLALSEAHAKQVIRAAGLAIRSRGPGGRGKRRGRGDSSSSSSSSSNGGGGGGDDEEKEDEDEDEAAAAAAAADYGGMVDALRRDHEKSSRALRERLAAEAARQRAALQRALAKKKAARLKWARDGGGDDGKGGTQLPATAKELAALEKDLDASVARQLAALDDRLSQQAEAAEREQLRWNHASLEAVAVTVRGERLGTAQGDILVVSFAGFPCLASEVFWDRYAAHPR